MDWGNFVKRARNLAHQPMTKPNLIGILDHRKSMHNELETTDFCWFECDDMALAQGFREWYQKRSGVQCIQLYFKNTLVSDSDPIKNFTEPDDGFAVFMAVGPVQVGTQPSTSASPPIIQSNAQASQTSVEGDGATASTGLSNHVSDTVPDVKQHHVKGLKSSSPVPAFLPSNNPPAKVDSPFEPDNTFRVSQEETTRESLLPLDQQIRRLIDLQDPDLLEAGVARAKQILGSFKHTLSRHDGYSPNASLASWTDLIDTLIPQANRNRTIIGVVGNTGAGKSSVINAILDEERLVPTNCMRACTAVVTEISWNGNPHASKYRAEIEFISPEDWEKELSVLMQELLSGNDTLSSEIQNTNSDAGIAWAKFRAVYPSVAKDELRESSIPTLMSKTSVNSILGTTKQICMDQPEMFYDELQNYVDSKEKVAKKGRKKAKVQTLPLEMEYWPLIKVVKIYTTSPVLSTGAVIVDLPGVHDNNAARAAVAQSYIKQCTSLWIVAPITRAVDDKAAKTLLGDSFKRQMKYDGGLSSVTFVCSKTDDISIMEAISSLGLEEEIAELNEQQVVYKQKLKQAETKIKDLKEVQSAYQLTIEDASNETERYLTFQERLEEGEVVYAPTAGPSKRKKVDSNVKPRKRRHRNEHGSENGADDDSEDCHSQDNDEPSSSDEKFQLQGERVQLFEPDVKKKLWELRDVKTNARDRFKNTIKELRSEIRDLKAQESRIKADIRHICITERNHYSKSAIQQDFAAGIKEIDQENAAEANEDSFDPGKDIRDYQEVAQSLPVFCVGSRAYQKMCGRMQRDDGVPGFVTADETEIPQLQDHCRKLTQAGRVQASRSFLTSFFQLLITARLLTSDTTPNLEMTDKDKKQLDLVKLKLTELSLGFDEILRDCIKEVRSQIDRGISSRFPKLVNDAIEAAPTKAQAWGQKDQRGLKRVSYKAVVRRDGVYQSAAAGHRDFNSDLVCPITKPLTSAWERTFRKRLPEAISKHVGSLRKLPRQFHEAVKVHAECNDIHPTILSLLVSRLPNYEQLFKDLENALVAEMKGLQREANRSFAPCVGEVMNAGYQACAAEHGPGSYKRMRELMQSHVEVARYTMFHKAVQTVSKLLDNMCDQLQATMTTKIAEIFNQMDADYMSTFGDHLMRSQTEEDTKLKAAIRQILRGVDEQFEPIANGDIRSVNGAAHICVKGENPNNDAKSKHSDTVVPAQESFKDGDYENDDLGRIKLDKLKSRSRGLTSREETRAEDDTSDSE